MKGISIENFLLNTIKIGLVFVLFTPLVMGPFGLTFSDYPKALFFKSLVEILFIFYLFLIFKNNNYAPKKSFLAAFLLLFYIILFVSSIFGINFYRSFFGDLLTAEGLILHFHLLAFFFISSGVFLRKKDWFLMFKMAVVISTVSSFAAILQQLGLATFYATSLPNKLSGTLSNPNFFGPYIALSSFLTIFILLTEEKKSLKFLWFGILFLNFYALFFSKCRSAFLGVFSGIIFLFLFYYLKQNSKQRKNILLAVLLFFVFLFLISLISPDYILNKILNIFDINFYARLDLWKISLEAFKERPVLGWGGESFSFIFDKYFKYEYTSHIPGNTYFVTPHNKILEVLLYSGILGLASYFLIFLAIFYKIFRKKALLENKEKDSFNYVISAFFVVYFIQNIFLFDNIGIYILFFLALSFVNNNFPEKSYEIFNKESRTKIISYYSKIIFIILAILIIVVFFYQANVKPTIAVSHFLRAISKEESNVKDSLDEYSKGINIKNIYQGDFYEKLADRLLPIAESLYKSDDKEKSVKFLEQIRPFLYKNIERRDQLQNHSFQSIARANQQIYLFYRNPKDLENTEKILEKAITFNPEIAISYQLLGETKILQDKEKEGVWNIKKSIDLDFKANDKNEFCKRLGFAYFKKGDFKKAMNNWQICLDNIYSNKKNNIGFAIQTALPYINSIANVYCNYLNDIENCRKVYDAAIEAMPEAKSYLDSSYEILISEIKEY